MKNVQVQPLESERTITDLAAAGAALINVPQDETDADTSVPSAGRKDATAAPVDAVDSETRGSEAGPDALDSAPRGDPDDPAASGSPGLAADFETDEESVGGSDANLSTSDDEIGAGPNPRGGESGTASASRGDSAPVHDRAGPAVTGLLAAAEALTAGPTPGAPANDDPAGDAPSAPLPNATITTLADYLLEGFWDWFNGGENYRSFNMSNSGTAAKNGTIHYNYTGFTGISGAGTDPNGLTTARRALVDDIFDYLEAVFDINFVQTTSVSTSVVDIYFKDQASGAFANSNLAGSGNGTANHRYINYSWVNVNSSWSGGTSDVNDYTYQTFIHEIFHAMGLGHQGAYNGSATYITDSTQATTNNNVYLNDSWQQSIMSYVDQVENTTITADHNFVITGMAADWQAMRAYYGSDAFTGNTIYGFSTNISAATSQTMADLSTHADETAFSIIDDGGTDTVNFSGYAANQRIDLTIASASSTTGTISDIGGEIGNMTLAVGTVIENAVGGTGNDTITGNSVGNSLSGGDGTDTLFGGSGGDSLYGGNDNDTLFGGSGEDSLYGGNDNDTLEGGFSTDSAFGGAGDDVIRVLAGEFFDHAFGGSGTDTLDHSTVTRSGDTFDFEAGTITSTFDTGTPSLSSIEIYLDGSGSNTIVSSGSGSYFGNGGDDFMISEIGLPETMDGGTGTDTIDHTRYSGSYDFDMVTGLTNFGGELYTNFENAIMGAGSDSVSGTFAANSISTNAGNDTIYGGSGNDSLYGGSGNDTIDAGADQDTVYAGSGDDLIIDTQTSPASQNDSYDGGTGTDTLVHDIGWASSVVFDLTLGQQIVGGFIRDTYANIENLTAGGDAVIIGSSDSNILTATDTFAGSDNSIDGRGGNDTIYAGNGTDTVEGGGGNDLIFAGNGHDTVLDGSGLFGGTDSVFGGDGNDTVQDFDALVGDYLDGGDGIDTFDRSGSGVFAGVIVDLGLGTVTFTNFPTNPSTDTAVNFENYLGDDLTDDVTGTVGANTILGNDGDDTIAGLAGADSLHGGAGNDTIFGGDDGDSIDGGDNDDNLSGDGGNDIIAAGAGGDTASGGDGNDTIDGGAGNDSIFGDLDGDSLSGGSGDDVIDGGGGSDTLDGGSDNDTIFGGDGNDTITDASGTNEVYGGAGNDSIVVGGGFVDTINGDAGDDRIGISSPFVLADGGGDDDTLDLLGISISPTFHFNLDTGEILNSGTPTGGKIANFEYYDNSTAASSSEQVTGTTGNNLIQTGGGQNSIDGLAGDDTLDGGDDDDTLIGGDGIDSLYGGMGEDLIDVVESGANAADAVIDGGSGFDTVSYANAASGVTVDLANNANNAGDAAGETYTSIEAVIGSAAGGNTLTGDANNNVLTGGDGTPPDALFGGDGDDTLFGGGGNDALIGGNGADMFFGGAGVNDLMITGDDGAVDHFDGGGGIADVVSYFSSGTGVTVNLGNQAENAGAATRETFTGVEGIRGSGAASNTLTGDGGGNVLIGGSASDEIHGEGGSDILYGGAAADTIFAGDSIDIVRGDQGNDVLYGGGGGDIFKMKGVDGTDTIIDFEVLSDLIEFQVAGVTGFGDLVFSDLGFATQVTAGTASVVLIGISLADAQQSGNFAFI